jgi:hypothetical protein
LPTPHQQPMGYGKEQTVGRSYPAVGLLSKGSGQPQAAAAKRLRLPSNIGRAWLMLHQLQNS